MKAIRNILDKALMGFCIFLFMEMTIVGTYQVVTRYFFNSPSTVSEEIVTYSFTWLSILGAAYVFGKRGHLCMAFLLNKFTGKNRIFLDLFSELLVILTAVLLLIYGGFVMAEQNFTQETASLQISIGLMYSVLPISGAIIVIYGIMNMIEMIKVFFSPEASQYGVESAS